MKQNKILLATILVVFVLAVIPIMSAAVLGPVLYAPLNYTNHTGTVTVNCTTIHEATNVTVWTNSSGGTMTQLGTLTNTSTNANTTTAWEGDVTITATNDGTNQNISCYADNGTVQSYSAETAATHIMLDTTDPLCSLVRLSRTIAWKDTQLITWTSSDAIELVSTAVTIDRPQDGSDMTYTDANRVLTLTSQDTKYLGDWTTTITGTDRPGNTCTETVTFKSYMPDGDIWEAGEPEKDKGKTLLLILIVCIVAYFIFKKK